MAAVFNRQAGRCAGFGGCKPPPPSPLPTTFPAITLSTVSQPTKDRSDWPQAKLASFDEVRAYRIKQWQEAGCSARLAAAWELVFDYWVGMKGMNPDELRLQRSITNLRRRAG